MSVDGHAGVINGDVAKHKSPNAAFLNGGCLCRGDVQLLIAMCVRPSFALCFLFAFSCLIVPSHFSSFPRNAAYRTHRFPMPHSVRPSDFIDPRGR